MSSADEAGAHAFVNAYFVEWMRAFATGNVTKLIPYRLKTCQCVRVERTIRDAYDAGGRIKGADITILRWIYGDHGPAFARTAIYFALPDVHYQEPGKSDVVEAALRGYFAIDLSRIVDRWIISDIRFKDAK